MSNVIAFPSKQRADLEIALRQMELLLSGRRQSPEFQSLNDEICRRKSHSDVQRAGNRR
ncbi:hypothetical protein [Arenimonas oryziterrae]|uniref:Uncharacterized protein n=1 Tax=Arenimonas oryziterrae DSM 21050 = YC6267 TaxID=1121015 RepID=A0A091AVY5_9GAMM|nr:hypothetical protein [Arenimonas oryziterrae]KFN42844.1 hypothetical protein N789_11985 [Arenimonas oryziterrae DSM 21050 = YC6267]